MNVLSGPGQLPVLLHVLRTCDPGVRQILMERIARSGSGAIARVLEQLLESDAPHPQSAVHYVSLAREPHYNRLLLTWLPRVGGALQAEMVRALVKTASAQDLSALERLTGQLSEEARGEAVKALTARPAKRVRSRPRQPEARALVSRPPASGVGGLIVSLPRIEWESPSGTELAAWALSALLSARMIWDSRAPSTPVELFSLLAFCLASARCLVGWPPLFSFDASANRRL
ncbi:MAG: hypothetical protein HYY25_05410 [Candidatus Wallbacteria bacterium]|nr:hypothetical protein [Candidatus Wallbacteria bacterium]